MCQSKPNVYFPVLVFWSILFFYVIYHTCQTVVIHRKYVYQNNRGILLSPKPLDIYVDFDWPMYRNQPYTYVFPDAHRIKCWMNHDAGTFFKYISYNLSVSPCVQFPASISIAILTIIHNHRDRSHWDLFGMRILAGSSEVINWQNKISSLPSVIQFNLLNKLVIRVLSTSSLWEITRIVIQYK